MLTFEHCPRARLCRRERTTWGNSMKAALSSLALVALLGCAQDAPAPKDDTASERSEEHTSELQSLMRISYAVFCLKKKKIKTHIKTQDIRRQQLPRK